MSVALLLCRVPCPGTAIAAAQDDAPLSPDRLPSWQIAPEGRCAGTQSAYGPVFVSNDRGQTWQDAKAPLLPGEQDRVRDIQAFGANGIVISGQDVGFNVDRDLDRYVNGKEAAPPPRGLLLKWDGSSWSRFTHARPTTFGAAYFVDAKQGWLAAYGEGIYKTFDGGQSVTFVPDYFRQMLAQTPNPSPSSAPRR